MLIYNINKKFEINTSGILPIITKNNYYFMDYDQITSVDINIRKINGVFN